MNYFCFVCQCAVSELEQIIVLLKAVHSLKSKSIIINAVSLIVNNNFLLFGLFQNI